MNKPFDLQALLVQLEAAGKPMLAADAKVLLDVVFSWTTESVTLAAVSQPLYLVAVPVIAELQKAADDEIVKLAAVAAPAAQ